MLGTKISMALNDQSLCNSVFQLICRTLQRGVDYGKGFGGGFLQAKVRSNEDQLVDFLFLPQVFQIGAAIRDSLIANWNRSRRGTEQALRSLTG